MKNITYIKRCIYALVICINVHNIVVAQTYCTPNITSGCFDDFYLRLVKLSGQSVTLGDTSNNCTGAYQFYSSMPQPDLIAGQTYTIDIGTSEEFTGISYLFAWIDYNQNGVFDAGERIVNSFDSITNYPSTSFSFTVPLYVSPGATRLRVMAIMLDDIDYPCGNPQGDEEGTVNDYLVNMISSTHCTGTPNAGTVLTPTSLSFGTSPATLTDSGASIEYGITYQWQMREPSGSGVWTDIAGANNCVLNMPSGLTSSTDFRFYVVCNSSGLSDTSNEITIPLFPSYCIPTFGIGCQYNSMGEDCYQINLVSLNGYSMSIYSPSDCSLNGYSDYSHLFYADLIPSHTYTLILDVYPQIDPYLNYDYAKIWIDYNSDGVFSPSEIIASPSTSNSSNSNNEFDDNFHSVNTFTVPAGIDTGFHRMRVRLASVSGAGPCGFEEDGEAEDYTVKIINSGIACTGTPNAGVILGAATSNICAGVPLSLFDSGAAINPGITYQWQQRNPSGTGTWTNIAGATGVTLSLPSGITSATDFRMYVVCANSNMSDTSNVVSLTMNSSPCYCIPTYSSDCTYSGPITNVTLIGESTSLNNSTTCSVNSYGYFTSLPAPDLAQSHSYNISVSTGNTSPNYDNVRAWIDYDNNGIFDSTEIIADASTSLGSGISPSGTSTFSFTIPSNAIIGTHRMRVRLVNYTTNIDPCSNYSFGEAEDYTINIIQGQPTSNTISAGTILGPATSSRCMGKPISLTDTGASTASDITYQWQQRNPSGIGTWTNIVGATNTSIYLPSGITSATDYRMYTVSANSNTSDTSNMVTITLFPLSMCYCTPTYMSSCVGGGGGISNVILIGESTSINNSTSCGDYVDYTSLVAPDLLQDSSYNLSVSTDNIPPSDENVRAWIDYNNNGIFESSEIIADASAEANFGNGIDPSGTSIFNFAIPLNVSLGIHRMRIRISYYTVNIDPCDEYLSGETEDYNIKIIALTPCSSTPDAGIVLGATTTGVCLGTPLTLIDSGASIGLGITHQWQHRPAGTGIWANIDGATTTLLSLPSGITEATDFRMYTVCTYSSSSDTSNIISYTVNSLADCYCTPIYSDPCYNDEEINNVTLIGETTAINNTTTCSNNGYGDYTSITAPDLAQDSSYNLSISTNFNNPSYIGVVAWIDYNDNSIFEISENIVNPNSSFCSHISTSGTSTFSFTIPPSASIGMHRMRVRTEYLVDTSIDPCTEVNQGEAEDYTVNVIPSGNTGFHPIDLEKLITLYPNPTKDIVVLNNESAYALQSVVISNVLGQVIYQTTTNDAKEYQIDVHNFPSGVYSIKVILNNGEWVVRKFEILK